MSTLSSFEHTLLPFSPHQLETIADEFGTPTWVTSEAVIKNRCQKLLDGFNSINIKMFYAMKANFNPHYIKIIKDAGIYGIDAVSPNEVRMAKELGYTSDQIIFTPSNPSDEEMKYAGDMGVLQNLGSLSELERFGKMFPGNKVAVRLSPDIGAGEFDKIITGPNESKFGIIFDHIPQVFEIADKYDLHISGLHCHIGSGFYSPIEFKIATESMCKVAKEFDERKELEFLDFGGGFGVQYTPGREEISLSDFANAILPALNEFNTGRKQEIEVRIEPGKFCISQSTVFLVKTTTKKVKHGGFAGVDSGFHHLIRPAMYGAYQHVVNVSNPSGEKEYVQIAGNNCESCDVFNSGVDIGETREGDLLAILVAGGYGSAMSSNYNFREMATEVLITENGEIKLTRKRQTYEQICENFTNL